MAKHEIQRMRMQVQRRKIKVLDKEHITPRMLRIRFSSNELNGFTSPSPDDHIKIFLPEPGSRAGQDRPVMRDFTPRAFDAEAGTIVLDFALHESGPATEWAANASVGDILEIGGPRGSSVVPDDFDWYLLIGDETALPSIGRRVEGLRAGVPVSIFVCVADEKEQQQFSTNANCDSRWVFRKDHTEADGAELRRALDGFSLPEGDGFIWIAAETSVAKRLYAYFVEERHHPKEWIKAAGYWSQGQADAGERIA